MGRPKKEDQDSTSSRQVIYDGLMYLLELNGMTKTDLITYAGISPNVVVSISRGEQISMFAAVKICELFRCDFVNIMTMAYSPQHDADAMYSMLLRMRKKTGHEHNVSITRFDTYTAHISSNYKKEGPKILIPFDLTPQRSALKDPYYIKDNIDRINNIFDIIDSQDPRLRE